jgi:hypothetical protein
MGQLLSALLLLLIGDVHFFFHQVHDYAGSFA